jgi:acetylornithine/N-succinyldiaminopimelate aminotransferase
MTGTLMTTYAPLPVTFERGEGVWLWDTQGERYLDAVAGVAVCNLGHAHPAVAEAICAQSKQLMHTSNLYGIANQQRLGDALTSLSGMERVFFSNSGAEANEAAIKLARLYGNKRNISNPTTVVMEQSFHGRTMATLTATGNRKVQAGFEPLLKGFVRIPYGDLDALDALSGNPDIVAVLVEPVQGEGGVNIPPSGYLSGIRALCDSNEWLMMTDEIQTGMGRTGRNFACQHEDILPDVMTLAKGLGNGMPIGACLARGEAAELFSPGSHGSTFGGNPLACAAALAVIDVMNNEAIAEHAEKLGEYISNKLFDALDSDDAVIAIRNLGCMIGIELAHPCAELVRMAFEQKLLINVTAERVVRLLPPLTMTFAEADQLCEMLASLIQQFLASQD